MYAFANCNNPIKLQYMGFNFICENIRETSCISMVQADWQKALNVEIKV